MAFVDPTQGNNANNTSNQPTAGGAREKRTVIGYVNLYVPLADGTRIKLISDLRLQLYKENAGDSTLMDLVKAGTITVEQLAQLVQVEISVARDKDAKIEIDLSKLGL